MSMTLLWDCVKIIKRDLVIKELTQIIRLDFVIKHSRRQQADDREAQQHSDPQRFLHEAATQSCDGLKLIWLDIRKYL